MSDQSPELESKADNEATPASGGPVAEGGVQSESAQDKEQASERWILVFLQGGGRSDPLGSLGPEVYNRVRLLLERHSIANHASVDVWLDSPGGSATIAYKLILKLRHYFEYVRVVVPSYAKSAATLFAIGADEIMMEAAAELGPLDVQVEHPDREGVRISGLDASRALGFLADFALDYIVVGGSSVFRSTELPRLDVVRETSTFCAKLLEPIIAKLDPQLVHRASQDLELATHYAVEVLRRRSNWTGPAQSLVQLAEHLVTHYPAHEYLISRDEASALNLPVTCLEEYDRVHAVNVLYDAYMAGKFQTNSTDHLISLWRDDETEERIKELISPPNEDGCEDEDDDSENDETAREDAGKDSPTPP